MLSHLILIATYELGTVIYPHATDEQTETKRLNNLPLVTQLAGGSRVCALPLGYTALGESGYQSTQKLRAWNDKSGEGYSPVFLNVTGNPAGSDHVLPLYHGEAHRGDLAHTVYTRRRFS